MRQSRAMSLVESIANVAVGYCLAVGTQLVAFPLFGLKVRLADNLAIGAIFTAISIGRSYFLRRLDRPMATAERQRRCRARKRREQTQSDPVPTEADLREWLEFGAEPDANDDALPRHHTPGTLHGHGQHPR